MDLLDFRESNGLWLFRLGPEKEGEVWGAVLREFKAAVAVYQRRYWRDRNHQWGVCITEENRAALIDIFDNARLCIETLENSMRLPGLD